MNFIILLSCSNENQLKIDNYKIGVVRNSYLMDHFQMSKELKQGEESVFKGLELYIDSLENNLGAKEKQLAKSLASDEHKKIVLENDYSNYYNQRAEAEEKLKKLEFENQLMIINRLNAYIDEFAEENDYDLIVGATEDGSVLYSKDKHDITELLIKYANEKYNGN
jgi:outer membrane protein